jgi:hypothetical protein
LRKAWSRPYQPFFTTRLCAAPHGRFGRCKDCIPDPRTTYFLPCLGHTRIVSRSLTGFLNTYDIFSSAAANRATQGLSGCLTGSYIYDIFFRPPPYLGAHKDCRRPVFTGFLNTYTIFFPSAAAIPRAQDCQ